MKFFQKRWVAITLCIVMIVAAIGIGQAKAKRNSYQHGSTAAAEQWGEENYAAYSRFLRDDGNLLSGKTEETLSSYNGAWDYSYESICGVVTVSSLENRDMEELSYDMAEALVLGASDCLLLVDAESQKWNFVYGDGFEYYVNSELELILQESLGSAVTDANRQLPELFEKLSGWYQDTMPVSGQAAQWSRTGLVAGGAVFFVLLIVILVIAAIVSAMVRASRRVVGGFRSWFPVFFYGPRRRPPYGPGPGPGPRPSPGPNPGPRPGSGSNRPSGGFGSSSRGGSFNSSRSGGFGSSSRGSGGNRGGFGSGKR